MSLNLAGIGGARRSVLPGAAVRQRSAGASSFIAAQGGYVSTSAGGGLKSRQCGGPVDKLSQQAYASALEEQIAARKLHEASLWGAKNNVPASLPLKSENADMPSFERLMRQRYGGPMAPAKQNDYASDLRKQIAARDAQRQADHASKNDFGADPKDGLVFGAAEIPALGGARRRHGAPPLPDKQQYANALHCQMQMRAAQKAAESYNPMEEVLDSELDALDEMVKGGRRHGAVTHPTKNDYGAQLLEQIAGRKAEAVRVVQAEVLSPPSARRADPFSEQRDLAQGKRQVSQDVPKSAYKTDLQKQMAERVAQRAANAFHVQAAMDADVPAMVREETPRGAGRRKCGAPLAPSHQSYAQELQEQIAQRKAQEQGLHAGVERAAFIGGDANDVGPLRGRRRVDKMIPASKVEYRVDLQRQMAERAHAQPEVVSPPSARGAVPFSEQKEKGNGRRHSAAPARGDSLERLMGANAEHVSCGEQFFGN